MRCGLVFLIGVILWACAPKPPQPSTTEGPAKEDIAPEIATGYQEREEVEGEAFMVAAANPHASRAGLEILKEGGSAADASIAMALVLTLVEPQSSGIGGGAFMMHYDAAKRRVQAFDGRETAPAAATADMFLDGGKPKNLMEALLGGLSVGVPGQLRMFELVHRAHGKLPWKRLFEPAIRLASEGFEVSPRLEKLVAHDPSLASMEPAASYFTKDGEAKPAGTKLENPQLAEVFRVVAERGADAFYEGAIAKDVVEAVRTQRKNPGRLTLADFAGYEAKEREAVCLRYRRYRICGMPPPSSGGITTLEILGLLERFDISTLEVGGVDEVHLFAEAGKLAYADRNHYIADPDFLDFDSRKLLDPTYLKERSALISLEKAMGEASPGALPGRLGQLADSPPAELPSTSHMVAVDREGNVVSMTASIEHAFGSHVMVRGFLLNNQLTDFAFLPEKDGKPVANRVEPKKRPRSSMAPVIVLRDDQFVFAAGSPGGSRIICYVARVLLAALDHGLGPQEAIDHPNFANRNGETEIERLPGWEDWAEKTKKGLEARGHEVSITPLNSGLHAIRHGDDGYRGGADPRREGVVLGQ